MNRSGVGGVLKGLSVIFAIVCFIGGIVAGNSVGSLANQYGDYGQGSFNWSSALSLWLLGAVFCALIYAIGEIVDQLVAIRQTVEGLSLDLKARGASPAAPAAPKPAPAEKPAAAPAVESAAPRKPSDDPGWVYCPSCGEKASRDFARIRKSCPDCGAPYEL